ncbi:MAG: helix-turn-helix transcriptional regulator [Rhizobiales bacterium]|nr:helix-turn-helix transcriptional regulator [Hyphomicrobiales bacterium]
MTEQHERLAKARRDAGYRTAISATTANDWNYSTYSQHERGQRGLTRKMAAKYAEAYNVSPGWLLTGETALLNSSAGQLDETLMAKVITGVERADTEDSAKLTPEARARIIARLYTKMNAAKTQPREYLVQAIEEAMDGKGFDDLFHLYLRHNHGCLSLDELDDASLPEVLSVVTCWGFVMGGASKAGGAASA